MPEGEFHCKDLDTIADDGKESATDSSPEAEPVTVPAVADKENFPSEVSVEPFNILTIKIEDQYDILDSKGTWCEGEVGFYHTYNF
jgi:hypothetical protein